MKFVLAFLISTLAYAEAPTIGVISPLSGDFAFIGEDCRKGILLAHSENKDATVSFVYGDAQNDPKLALKEYARIQQSAHPIAFIVFRGPLGMALAPIAGRDGIALIGGVGNPRFTKEGSTSFQAWPIATDEGAVLADHLLKNNDRSVAIVTVQDDWTTTITTAFQERYTAQGGSIVLNEQVLPTEAQFAQLITKIKRLKPDAVFVNLGIAQSPQFLKELLIQKVAVHKYSNFWAASPDAIKNAGIAASEGVRYTEMNYAFGSYQKNFEKMFEHDVMRVPTFTCYLGAHLLLQQLSKSSAITTYQKLLEALSQQKSFSVPDLTIPIKDRQMQIPLRIRRIHEGRIE